MIVTNVGEGYSVRNLGVLGRTYEFSHITYDEWVELLMRSWEGFSPRVEDCEGQWSVGYLKGLEAPDNVAYYSAPGTYFDSWVVLRVEGEFSGEKILAKMARGM